MGRMVWCCEIIGVFALYSHFDSVYMYPGTKASGLVTVPELPRRRDGGHPVR
jgi:hypothetical protein